MVQGFSVHELDGTGVVKITLLDKYLNYDISEATKTKIKQIFEECSERGVRRFALDLEHVTIVDSCGVGVLISLQNAARAHEGQLLLIHLSPFLSKVLKMMHLDDYFHVYATEEEALEASRVDME